MRADTRIEPQLPGVERLRRMPEGGVPCPDGAKTESGGFPERNPSAGLPVLSTENCFIWTHRAVKRNGEADVLKKRVLRHIFIKKKRLPESAVRLIPHGRAEQCSGGGENVFPLPEGP